MFSKSNDFVTKLDVVTQFDFFPNSEKLSQVICKEYGILMEDTYYSGYLAPSHSGLHVLYCSNQSFWKL